MAEEDSSSFRVHTDWITLHAVKKTVPVAVFGVDDDDKQDKVQLAVTYICTYLQARRDNPMSALDEQHMAIYINYMHPNTPKYTQIHIHAHRKRVASLHTKIPPTHA